MGGLCLRTPGGRCHQLQVKDIDNAITASKTATQAKDTVPEIEDVIIASATDVENTYTLVHSEEWVRELKLVKESDIEDLAKLDSIEKLLTSIQGLWVLTHGISRIYQSKALSLLEVTTSAYLWCDVGIYAFWWKKPQNCSMPIMITCSDEAIDALSSSAYRKYRDSWAEFIWAGRDVAHDQEILTSYPIHKMHGLTSLKTLSLMIFGSIHLASWNIRFPSTIELWMWQGSSLYCVIYAGIFASWVYWADTSEVLSDELDGLMGME